MIPELRAPEHKFQACLHIALETLDWLVQTETGNSERKALSLDTLTLESFQ